MSAQAQPHSEVMNSMEMNPANFGVRLFPFDELAQMNTAQLISVSGAEAVGSNRLELLELAGRKNQNLSSDVLNEMNTSQLIALSGAEAVGNNRLELLEVAKRKQISRLGSYISGLSTRVEPVESVVPATYPTLTVEGQVPSPIKADRDVLGRNLVSYINSITPMAQPEPAITPNRLPQASVAERPQHAEVLPTIYMPTTIPSPVELSRQLKSPNVLSNRVREALSNTIEMLTPSGKTLGRVVAGLALFATAYGILPNYSKVDSSKGDNGEASSGATAEAPATAPLDSAPTETTIEIVTTTEAPTPETTAAPTITVEATTTTEVPKSISEQLLTGEISPEQVAAVKYAEIDIPALCLDGISAYGSNRRNSNDVAVLNYFVEQGLLSAQDSDALAKGTASDLVEAKFHKLFDEIYLVEQADIPQEACATAAPMDNPKYPARWLRTLQDESTPGIDTVPVKDIEPVVDIDTQGALPGQEGNVIISGHRTTDSAVFANLDQLRPGDSFTINTDDGKSYTYIVEENSPVDVNLIDADYYGYLNSYASPTGGKRVATLMTCSGGTEDRIIVRAVLVEEA